MNYQTIKKWLTKHKKEVAISCGGVLLFLLGFGTHASLFEQKMEQKYRINQTHYTTPQTNITKEAQAKEGEEGVGELAQPTDKKCPIKGNISTKSKIYHIPSGKYYTTVKPEQCFTSEEEAKQAGFRKSGL